MKHMVPGVPILLEGVHRRKDGTTFPAEIRLSMFESGGKKLFLALVRDVTERKHMEEELQESEEHFKMLAEHAPFGISIMAPDRSFEYLNPQFTRIFGYTIEDIPDKDTWFEKAYPDKVYREKVISIWKRDTAEEVRIGEENPRVFTVRCKDGRDKSIDFRRVELIDGKQYQVYEDITARAKAEEAVRTSEKRYRQIVDNADDIIYGTDKKGRFTLINPVAERITGYSEDELLSRHYLDLVNPAYRKDTERFYRLQIIKRRQNTYYEFPIVTRDGTEVWLGQNVQLVIEGERIVGFQAVARDITNRKQAEKALQASEGRYRSLVEFTEDPVYLIDREERYLFINEKYLSRLGVPRDQIIGKHYGEFHSCEDEQEFSGYIEQVMTTGRFVQYEHRSRSDGRYFLRTLSPVQEPDGRIEMVTVIAKDITERKQVEKKLTYMATHDFLTGLPNRVLFNDRLTLMLAQARRHQQKLCVMLLDLDYFKDINDTLGHSVGDKLLRIVGERLTGLLRTSDTIARMGGDEFLLLLTEIARGNNVTTIAQKILKTFREPFAVDGHELMITTSIGIAIFPDDGEDADTLVKNADIALYRAKERGRDNFQRYTPT